MPDKGYWPGLKALVVTSEFYGSAIRIGNPASWEFARKAILESNGQVDKVTDQEIVEAYKLVARTEGLFVEPASAAALAGLEKSSKVGLIPEGSLVVATMTGHGLKDPENAMEAAEAKPTVVEATKEAVMKMVDF